MPIYPGRRAGTWRVQIHHRKRNHEWIVEGTRAEAKSYEARMRVELDAGKPTSDRTAPTFNEFCKTVYEPHAKAHLKESTWSKVRCYQVATLREHLGGLKLTAIDPTALDKYKRARTAAGLRPSSVNNELRVLSRILSHARALKYPCIDRETKIQKLPVRGAPRARAWTAAETLRIFDACKTEAPELLPTLLFMANTGVRKGEAIAAEWSWIDDARGLVCIPSNEVWQPKNGLPRELPLSSAVRVSIAGPKRSPTWLFPSRFGGRYAAFPEELFRRVLKAAKVTGSPHRFRHTYASHFLAAMPDMQLLGQVLGHSTTRVTELYSHLLPGHLERAREAVSLLPTLAATLAKPEEKRRSKGKSHMRH
jgi:integrase